MAKISTSIINDAEFEKQLFKTLNTAMLVAAEPIVQKALKEVEVEMRKQLASNLISFITNNYTIQTRSDNMVITVKQAERNPYNPIA